MNKTVKVRKGRALRKFGLLTTTGEEDILDPPANPPDLKLDRTYVVSMRTVVDSGEGDLELYFKDYPSDYKDGIDGPLEMSVPKDHDGGRIILTLDPYWNWHFRDIGAGVTLGKPYGGTSTSAQGRYRHLVPFGRNTVAFTGLYFNDKKQYGNRDPINLYVELDQFMRSGSPAPKLAIKIDPDIRNPGDPPQIIGTGKLGAKKKKKDKKKA